MNRLRHQRRAGVPAQAHPSDAERAFDGIQNRPDRIGSEYGEVNRPCSHSTTAYSVAPWSPIGPPVQFSADMKELAYIYFWTLI